MIQELKNSPQITIEAGKHSCYQIETENFIFDFDLVITDTYKDDNGTYDIPPDYELINRDVEVSEFSILNKKTEDFMQTTDELEELIINKFK